MASTRSRLGVTQEVDLPLLPEHPPSGPWDPLTSTLQPPEGTPLPAFEVYLLQGLYEDMLKHVWKGYIGREHAPIEVTGIIAGHAFHDPTSGLPFIVGVEQLKLETPNQSLVHVHVNPEEIGRARHELEERGLAAVIWYHSHPGHGIFLSSDDQVITDHIFNASWHVAIVFDPISHNEWGMFRGPEREIVPGLKIIREEPEEIKLVRLYNLGLNAIKQHKYDLAEKYFQRIDEQFRQTRASLPYWKDQVHYRDVATHLQCLPAYAQAMAALEGGDRARAAALFWQADAQPEGYLDVRDRLAALADDGLEQTIPRSEAQEPSKSKSKMYPPNRPASKGQERSPKEGKPWHKNRSLPIAVVVMGVSLLGLGGMALAGLFDPLIATLTGNVVVSAEPTQPTAVIEETTAPLVISVTATPTLLPTDTPPPTPFPTIQHFIFVGRVDPSAEPSTPSANGNLLVRVFDDQKRLLPDVEVVVTIPSGTYRNSDDPDEGPPGPRMTDINGEYLQTGWAKEHTVDVYLGEYFQNMRLQGEHVSAVITPGKITLVIFIILPVYVVP